MLTTMSRTIVLLCLAALAGCSNTVNPKDLDVPPVDTLFDLQTRTLQGEPQDLGAFEGKVVLVVNTASKCGLTPQYAGLQALHEEYAERGLVVLGFPSNQFLGQEPGSPAEIATFCSENYGVTFPMMEKVEVKAGSGQSPVYALLASRTGKVPDWNFAKYLVSRDGAEVTFFGARTDPGSEELRAAIEAALQAG